MDAWDQSMEERVWQRVMSRPEQARESEDLRPLLQTARELAAVYRQLYREAGGKDKALLHRLYEEETANAACLKGMLVLRGSQPGKGNVVSPKGEPWAKLLEKCYHRTCRQMVEYTARSAGAEFGEVFRHMADRERELCGLIVELLGK